MVIIIRTFQILERAKYRITVGALFSADFKR